MQQPIRAFVGHSFTTEDSHLVDIILRYLSRISDVHPSFSWEHAENPEPTMVDEKVLGLLADKNLFIGICTRKERVISPAALTTPWYSSKLLVAPQQEFQWKASDWIIQEIGLAVGRGLKVILLLEDGVKTPGALQGNLEYIPLNRTNPEKAFDSLLAMITSLTPKPQLIEEPLTLDRPSEEPQKMQDESGNKTDESLTPKAEWTIDDYEKAAMHFLFFKQDVELKDVTDKFLTSAEGSVESNRIHFHGWIEYIKIICSRNGNLATLKQMAVTNNNPDLFDYLGESYEHFDEYLKAAESFNNAATLFENPDHKVRMYGKAAFAYEKAGLADESRDTERKMRSASIGEQTNVELILKAELKLAEYRKADDLTLAAMEHLLEINPTDNETRFSAAYKYSNVGQQELALLHYLRIPYGARDAVTWNNLGVCFDNFVMPIKSTEAYRQSEAKGESLAISNLAIKFLNAGFATEAKALLERGLQITDHHKNIDTNFAKLKEAPEAEDEKVAAAISKAKPISDFYRNVGRALTLCTPSDLSGTWKSPNSILTLTVRGNLFVATGTYEVKNALIAALSLTSSKVEITEYSLEYRGTIQGHVISGTVTRKRLDEKTRATTLLGDSTPTIPFLMWLSSTSNELHVLEQQSSSSPRTYELYRNP